MSLFATPRLAYLAVFIGMLGHASTEFAAVQAAVSGPEVSVWRFTLGALGLIVLCLALPNVKNLFEPLRRDFWPLLGLSLIGVTLGYLLFHWALDFATVPQVATTVTTMPIFIGLVNQWRTGERIDLPKWLTGIAAVIGIALLITDGALRQLAGSGAQVFGIMLTLLCALFVGAYTMLAKPYIKRYGALRVVTSTMTIGAIGLWLAVGVFFGRFVMPNQLFDHGPGTAIALLTIALWNTTITQWLWLGGLAAVPDITRGSYLFFLKPVVAALLAGIFLSQPVTWIETLAIAIICGSVLIEALWPREARRKGAPTVQAPAAPTRR